MTRYPPITAFCTGKLSLSHRPSIFSYKFIEKNRGGFKRVRTQGVGFGKEKEMDADGNFPFLDKRGILFLQRTPQTVYFPLSRHPPFVFSLVQILSELATASDQRKQTVSGQTRQPIRPVSVAASSLVFLISPGWDVGPSLGYPPPPHQIRRYPFIQVDVERHCEHTERSSPRWRSNPDGSIWSSDHEPLGHRTSHSLFM